MPPTQDALLRGTRRLLVMAMMLCCPQAQLGVADLAALLTEEACTADVLTLYAYRHSLRRYVACMKQCMGPRAPVPLPNGQQHVGLPARMWRWGQIQMAGLDVALAQERSAQRSPSPFERIGPLICGDGMLFAPGQVRGRAAHRRVRAW